MAKYVKTEQGYQDIETTVVPVVNQEIVTTVPPMVGEKMDKNNPVGTGSFSMGRKPGSVIGASSHAEGLSTTASGSYSHAEGSGTIASGSYSHAEGHMTTASGDRSHAEGYTTTASGIYSHAEGVSTIASGESSHAEGWSTTAGSQYQHVQGRYNVVDSQHKYANIVGNGTSASARSNAHTLDWNGVPWFEGRPQFGGTAQNQGSQTVMANGDKEIILASTTTDSTKKFKITVDDDYNVSATNTSDSVSKTLATTEYVDSSVSKSNPLNITGATVGQIAKITAVDDSGKPTAWAAVDMPSGGGTAEEYELIFTDTVTEDTAAYFRDTDANGNTFALKKVILIVFTPPYEESDTSYGRGVGFLPTVRWGHYCISSLRDPIKSSVGGTGQYDVIFAEIIMGYQVCTAKFESQNTTNVFSVMQPVTKAGVTGLQFVSDATKLMQISNPTGNMTCVKIVGYASPIIAKNTQIALYGVRA